MAKLSFDFRNALDKLRYLQSMEGSADQLFQKIVSNMEKYKILVDSVDEIYICHKKYFFNKISYRIHVTYREKGGDFKLRIYDKGDLDLDESNTIMNKIEIYLNKEKFEYEDITNKSSEKDKNILRMLKIKI